MANEPASGETLRSQARAKASRGDWEVALGLYSLAVNAFRQSGAHAEVALTLAEVADHLNQRGKLKHAAAFYQQALAAAAKAQDGATMAPILRDGGFFFSRNGEKVRAFDMLKDAFELYEIQKDEWAQAMVAHELGAIQLELGKHEDALEWLRRALPLAPEERDPDLRMRIYFDLGRALLKKGYRERAQACFNNSALIAKKIFDADTLIASLEMLGSLSHEAGDIGLAKRHLKEAYVMNEGLLTSRRGGASAGEGEAAYEKRKDELVRKMISAYLADPHQAASERELAEFIAHLFRRRDFNGLGSAFTKVAEHYRVRGDHAKAARFFENASSIFERAGMAYVSSLISGHLGDLYRDRGLPRKAFNRYWKGATLIEGDTQPENEAMRKSLMARMEALKPAIAEPQREGDAVEIETAVRGGPAQAAGGRPPGSS